MEICKQQSEDKEERYSRVPRLFVLCHDLIDVLNKNKEERYSRVPRLSHKRYSRVPRLLDTH